VTGGKCLKARCTGIARFAFLVGIALVVLIPARAYSDQELTLAQAIDRALKFAPSISIAAAASDFSSARVDEARAPLYPSLSGIGGYYQAPGYQTVITNRGQTQMGLELNYTAYDFGRRMATARAAQYQSIAATLGVRAAQARIVYETTVAYFSLQRARQALGELQTSLNRLNRYMAVIEQLRSSGKAIANDVLRIRTARDNAALTTASAQQAVQQAAIVLGSLIGDFTFGDIRIKEVDALPPLPRGELSHNPTLLADRRNIDAAKATLKAAAAERYPTLGVQLTAGFLGVDPPDTFSKYAGASYAGTVTVPIYQGGLINAHINEARAQQMQAIGQLSQDELTLARQLADATTRYNQARHQIEILDDSQATANDSFALDWTRFLGGGKATLLEVLDAYTQALNFRLALIDQEFAVREATAQVALIFGESR
jgi:outer membrane protein TolC